MGLAVGIGVGVPFGAALESGPVLAFATALPTIPAYDPGDTVSITLPAATGGTTPYMYSVAGNPSWLTFTEATRTLAGTAPATADAGAESSLILYSAVDSATPQARGVLGFNVQLNLLRLSDFDATGLTLARHNGVAVLALVETNRDGDTLYRDTTSNQGRILDGSVRLNDDSVIGWIREQTGGDQITLNRTGATAFSGIVGASGSAALFPGAALHIQTLEGRANFPFNAAGGGFARWRGAANDDIADDIVEDERFIIALSYTP